MNPSLEFSHKLITAYGIMCKPLCRELKLPQTAFDILMFLANNPEYKTAGEIVEYRKIKANLVSVNVDKLVKDGYLRREAVEGDRRKMQLLCTEKSKPVIEKGRKMQAEFLEALFSGVNGEMRDMFFTVTDIMNENLDTITEEF